MARRTTRKTKATDPFADRIKRLRASIRTAGVDHLLVLDRYDVAYLTGFHGGDSYLLVTPSGKPVMISDFRYDEELNPQRPLCRIHMRTGSIVAAVADVAAQQHERVGIETFGIPGSQASMALFESLKKAFRGQKIPVRSVTPVENMVGELRLRKDAGEIKLIKKAATIQEEALEATLPQIRSGMTELEVCALLEYEMKARGSQDPAFNTIVAAQANGSMSHYRPSTTTVKRGKPLLIDWGATYDGYHSDMTRTFHLGRWSPIMKEIYTIVRDAQEMAAAALKPGASTRDVDAVARDHITAHGYGEQYGHGLGHGIGLNVHEDPRLSHMTIDTVLEPGHVVTVEPGIYLPGIGGVRIEDDYAITERGARNLSTLPKDIEWCTL